MYLTPTEKSIKALILEAGYLQAGYKPSGNEVKEIAKIIGNVLPLGTHGEQKKMATSCFKYIMLRDRIGAHGRRFSHLLKQGFDPKNDGYYSSWIFKTI